MRLHLVVFCAFLGIASAAVGLAKLQPKPEKYKSLEGCYLEELDTVVPFGEARPSSDQCMEYRCGQDWVQYVSCGVVVVTPPLELEEHKERPYPDCCPTLKKPIPQEYSNAAAETTNKL